VSSSLFLHCHDGLGFVGWADDGEEGMIMMAGIEARDDWATTGRRQWDYERATEWERKALTAFDTGYKPGHSRKHGGG
jgi:hypothetical protein